MKSNFQEQLENVAQAAHNFIKKNLKKGLVLNTELEIKKGVVENPSIHVTGRHGDSLEYAIMMIENNDGNIILHTSGITDACFEDEEEFDLSEVDDKTVCRLADFVASKI